MQNKWQRIIKINLTMVWQKQWTKKIYFAYINWSQLAKSLVFQWSGLLENRTKWRPSCFWTIGTQNFKIFGIPMCLVFQCSVFKPPPYLLPVWQELLDDPKYLRTRGIEWAEIFLGHLCQKCMSLNLYFLQVIILSVSSISIPMTSIFCFTLCLIFFLLIIYMYI